jgi:hypothetical protein
MALVASSNLPYSSMIGVGICLELLILKEKIIIEALTGSIEKSICASQASSARNFTFDLTFSLKGN